MSSEEHVVDLDRGADEETGQRKEWKSETSREGRGYECLGLLETRKNSKEKR